MLLLLFRRLRPHHHHHLHLRRHHCRIPILPFSSSPESHSPPSSPTPTSLSARMSFVFDQIDAIEKERSEKDQTLQRIRAWRESKKQQSQSSYVPPVSTTVSSSVAPVSPEVKVDPDPDPEEAVNECNNLGLLLNGDKRKVEIVHPWPEWIEWMERLLQQNYFDHKRKDEDGMMENLGFNLSEIEAEEDGFDFARDFKTVQTAVLNFGKDRFDILRSLSRQDLQILVGYGCPSADKKVVFSSKLLRKLVHLDEGDVCSSCSLRSSCERAYLVTNKEDEARTIDVVRVLLTYGFDTVNGSVTNKPLLKMKNLKTVIRRLLHEVVKLSAVPIDPNLPPPVIKKPPPKVKQPPPTPKRRVGRDDIEMKKGDWLCPKCDFMNFAKNSICLQCDAKRPKRQLLPGEWECPQCNFLNYRRNMVCFHCEHKRPPDETMESQVQERQRGPRRPEKVPDRREFSNAWNFDFDDNESDGADIAAFENADSQRMNEDFSQNRGRGHVDGYHKGNRETGLHEKDSDVAPSNPGIGFNDFDDEDDDLDSYELETPSGGQKPPPRVNFSELEVDSMSEDEETTDRRESNCHAQNRPSRSSRQKVPSSEDEVEFGSDDDLPVHPNWKSSHITQFDQRSKRRGGMSFGSDDELSSDPDDIEHDFGSRKKKGNNRSSSRGGNSDFEDGSLSDVEPRNNTRFGSKNRLGNRNGQRSFTRGGSFDFEDSDVESNSSSSRFGRGGFGNKGNKHRSFQRGGSSDFEDSDLESNSRSRYGRGGFGNKGNTHGSFRRRGNSDSEDDFESNNTSRFGRGGFRNRGNSRFDSKRNSSKESLGRSSRGSHGKMSDDDFGGFKKNGRNDDFRNSRSSRAGTYKERSDNQRGDSYLDDDRFRRPRVNVR